MRPLLLLSCVVLAAGLTTLTGLQARVESGDVLDTPAGPASAMYALSPQVRPHGRGVDAERPPILSWIDPLPEGGGHALRFSVLDGRRWSAPRDVARGTNWFANWADHPSVVWVGDQLLAHWLVRSGDGTSRYGYGLRIARSTDAGRQWTALHAFEPADTQDYAGFVAFSTVASRPGAAYLAPARSTAAVASPSHAGTHHAEPQKALMFARFRPNGAADTDLLDADVCSCCSVATAMTTQGPIVVYRDHKPGEIRDIALVRSKESGWTDPVTVHEDGWVLPGCPTNGPAVSADGHRVAVAWFTAARQKPQVQVAFSRDGGASFGAPVGVDDGTPIGWAGVVLTADGDAIVSWLEGRPGGAGQVRLRRVKEGSSPGPAVVVAETRSGRSTGIPQLSRSGGHLVVAWRDDRVRSALVPLDAVELSAPRSSR